MQDFISQNQTSAIGSQLREDMRVVSSDGQPVGTIDRIEGDDRIKLKRSDSPDGEHHYFSLTDVDRVEDDAVILSMSHAEAQEFLANEHISDDDLPAFDENPELYCRSSGASTVEPKEGSSMGPNPVEPDRFVR